MYLPFYPRWDDNFQIHELSSLPIQTIIALGEVISAYDSFREPKFYKKVILMIQRTFENIEIGIVVVKPAGDMSWNFIKSLEAKDCPSYFVNKLGKSKSENIILDGCPSAILEFSKDVRDYIFERANRKEM